MRVRASSIIVAEAAGDVTEATRIWAAITIVRTAITAVVGAVTIVAIIIARRVVGVTIVGIISSISSTSNEESSNDEDEDNNNGHNDVQDQKNDVADLDAALLAGVHATLGLDGHETEDCEEERGHSHFFLFTSDLGNEAQNTWNQAEPDQAGIAAEVILDLELKLLNSSLLDESIGVGHAREHHVCEKSGLNFVLLLSKVRLPFYNPDGSIIFSTNFRHKPNAL